ncbi:hypothetical protein K432DRAFT_299897 [Lepidopterella palustris CBS 459.81]|uniref:ER membrane protein complex subunit 7 beta-sandwich domain-containing protein n=1 Tax=Lepidopterella palustris CBS 459.81 TaxID=1314670 RepID=A0A8E2E945_9PEZI|nr:hypothetical protein K432DRAFT_299897 [Lepidopterella palustris CBS 459.81]
MRLSTATPLLPLLTPLTIAVRLTLTIPSTPILQNPSLLPPTTHATLQSSGAPLSAPLSRSNTFVFDNVTQGSWLAVVHSHDFAFEMLRVDVTAEGDGKGGEVEKVEAWQSFLGNEWDNRGEVRGMGVVGMGSGGGVVVEVRAVGVKEFYQARGGFSPLSFLKNPMILMALFSLVLIVGMPYLIENMDPETKAEFEEIQKKSPLTGAGNPASQLQNFDFASWMAGKTAPGVEGQGQVGQAKKR